MAKHAEKLERIVQQLKTYQGDKPLSLKSALVRHTVPNPKDKRYGDNKIDISDLDQILSIDPEQRICIAEPGVTFSKLVKATLRHGLVPYCVPEHKAITIGGAIAGCSIESMSFQYGGFHDSCIELEVLTPKGEQLTTRPDDPDNLLFQMLHGTFGTLGIITRLTFKLLPAKPYVQVINEKYPTIEAYLAAIQHHYQTKDIDFMDGLIFSGQEYVLCTGRFVDHAPYTHNYEWMRIYYQMARHQEGDFLKTYDYFFRYDKGTTHVSLTSPISRFFLAPFTGTTTMLWFAHTFRKILPPRTIPIVIDVFLPIERVAEFLAWHEAETGYFPLWCVPYKAMHSYEWLSDRFHAGCATDLLIDIAVYSLQTADNAAYYRKLEQKLLELGGLKTLIADNYFSEADFWQTWNRENYYRVKEQIDPQNLLRDLYQKTVLAMRGL